MNTKLATHTADLRIASMDTPVGELLLALNGRALCAVHFVDGKTSIWPIVARRFGADAELTKLEVPHPAVDALRAYFDGRLDALEAIEVDPEGTPFQQRVWSELRRIPVGRTASYADIAQRIGAPKAYRAVARANATNPIGVVIPCHRVIGADGALRGYGGGVERKAWLLAHEGAVGPAAQA